MAFKFGLGAQKKASLPTKKPAFGKAAAAFGDSDDDEPTAAPDVTANSSSKKSSKKAKLPTSQYGDLSSLQTHKKNAEKALEVDASIYDYDAAYDAIHARAEAKKAADREDAAKNQSKYMENLMASAEIRKRDQLRAKEKMLQRERAAEGEEFADKEKFVTSAYKQQQEETRLLEIAEKKKEQAELEKRNKGGNQAFYRSLMDEQDRTFQATVAATAEAEKHGIKKTDDEEVQKTDVDVAKELNAKGASIALTDDGEVADKRQLLSAGLNVRVKPKPKETTSSTGSMAAPPRPNLGDKASNQKASRERQSRMLEAQLEQMMKRQADESTEDLRKTEQAAKSRKTDGDISSAKERYLQRKKEAAAAAAAKKEDT